MNSINSNKKPIISLINSLKGLLQDDDPQHKRHIFGRFPEGLAGRVHASLSQAGIQPEFLRIHQRDAESLLRPGVQPQLPLEKGAEGEFPEGVPNPFDFRQGPPQRAPLDLLQTRDVLIHRP